jgi:hypothetical protein
LPLPLAPAALAALDLVQDRPAGDAELAYCLVERHVAVGDEAAGYLVEGPDATGR